MNSIFKRISVRKYETRPVEDEKLEKLLRAAMAAPSAGNQQPWEFYIVTAPAAIDALSQASPYTGCAKGAPCVIVPCARRNNLRYAAYSDIDMSAACENLLLEAAELGLGTVWMGIAPMPERMDYVAGILNLPETLAPFALIPCGYPAEERPQEDRYDPARVHYVR